jgi:pyruvate,orthophosphate dikinase
MPGMMDTVLNLGLNDAAVAGLARATGDERFAQDAYRRLVQMYGNVVAGIPGERFEAEIARVKAARGVRLDTELDVEALRELTVAFRALYELPDDPMAQLEAAIRAVFDSWDGERARAYRRIHGIPDDWGTAVNVQQMVFGNRGERSGSGVAFSRDELTGAPEPSGDFLVNAQGEDVVSGVRTPLDLAEMRERFPEAHRELMEILRTLERHERDMQDVEFTVEDGRLYVLQTRAAKRPAQAAVRFACDAVDEGLLEPAEALATIDAERLETLLHPTFDPHAEVAVAGHGVAASPGAAKGEIVFTAEEAVEAAAAGRDVILVRPFTEADDVAGFHAAKGVLTSEGGKASHAALVARGMGVPAVTGAADVEIDLDAQVVRLDGRTLRAGDRIAIDGTRGWVTTDDVPLVDPEVSPELERVLAWADELRRLEVRANADTPEDARRARAFGAEGIGLCRTEHMFFGTERHALMLEAIVAASADERRRALARLGELQRDDMAGLFDAMDGRPVTIRLLDPPLHEFLPSEGEVQAQLERARAEGAPDTGRLERLLGRVRQLQETNPMLGTRGVRVGVLAPDLYEMQVEAAFGAAVAHRDRTGRLPRVEIMVPLVAYERELALVRDLVVRTGRRFGLEAGEDYLVGTMIELPRACLLADRIAAHADFFSFGTNDLTQTTVGFSRDDVEGRILGRYIDLRIVDRSPFETLDEPGVGQLVRMGAWLGRKARPDLELGVCGEHGGDPDSIAFFHRSGIDYVSCSPYRVPVARVAAAQAAIRERAAEAQQRGEATAAPG